MDFGPHPDLPYSSHPRPNASYYLNPLPPPLIHKDGRLPEDQGEWVSIRSFRSSADSMKFLKRNQQDSADAAPSGKKPWRFHAAFASLCIVNFVCALDATILSVALPIIAEQLHGTAIEAFWAGTSFLLTATVFQPIFASLSHAFGRKEMLLVALTFFTAGTIAAGVAHDFTVMLVGRSIQGVGGGGISALTYIIVTDMVTLKERGKWFGLITMMWAVGSVVGPVVGGALAQHASWRWIFWLNLPFCGISYFTIPFFLTLKRKDGSILYKLRQIDWLGSFLFVASVTSFLIPITWGGVMYAWEYWRTTVPLFCGVIGFLLFMMWSNFYSGQPILRGSMFKSCTAIVSYYGTVVHGIFLWASLYYMPLYFEAAKGLSPTMSGVALFPWTFTTAPAAVITGILVSKTGKYRWGIWSGWFLSVLGIGLLILYKEDTPSHVWIPIGCVSGIGLGILYSANSFAIQASSSNEDLPYAAALYSFFRSFGQMLGVAIGGAIFQNEVKENLLSYPELASKAVQLSKDASALVETIKHLPASQAVIKTELIATYVDSLRTLWIVMTALAGSALIVTSLFTDEKTLERELDTDQGFVYDPKGSSNTSNTQV